jgi:hypothetical protein
MHPCTLLRRATLPLALLFASCATVGPSMTLEEQLVSEGYKRISAQEIKSLLTGNTLHGKFGSSTVTAFLGSDGRTRGELTSSSGSVSRDRGRWEVSADGFFCDQWENWRAGSDCDRVYLRGSEFVLINLDGTKSSDGRIEQGNSRGL